jgi:hypothetical protein
MRIVRNAAAASSLTSRPGTGYGVAGHSQPKTHFDEQPSGSPPGGIADAVWMPDALDTGARLAASPKLNDTISNQRVTHSGVLVHSLFLSTRSLVTRVLVTRSLVNR